MAKNEKKFYTHSRPVLKKLIFSVYPDIPGSFKVVSTDELKLDNLSEKGFSLIFSRHVHLNPEAIFDVFVEIELPCHFDSKTSSKFEETRTALQEKIESTKADIVDGASVAALASLLISQVTLLQNFNPLVSYPYYEEPEKKQD